MSDPLKIEPEPEFSLELQESDDEWATRILTSSPFSDLISTWQEARPEGGQNQKLPTTDTLTAEKMSAYLQDISIFDCISEDEIVYRFVGTRIAERMGHDVTGENLLELSDVASRAQIKKILLGVIRIPQISLSLYINNYSSGRQADVISLLLPVEGPKNKPPRIIALHSRASTREYLNKRNKIQIGTSIERQISFSI